MSTRRSKYSADIDLEWEQDEPSALVAALTRFIVREYAGCGRDEISMEEITHKIDAVTTAPEPVSAKNIKAALDGAVSVHALHVSDWPFYSAFAQPVLPKPILRKPNRAEYFELSLVADTDHVTLADYMGLWLETGNLETDEENDTTVTKFQLKNAHRWALVGCPKDIEDAYDSELYPQCDQSNRIVKLYA